jgi:hypothetical protein
VSLFAHAQCERHPEGAAADDTDSAGHDNDISTTVPNMRARKELRIHERLGADVS